MAQTERTRRRGEWKGLLAEDRDFLKGIVQTAVQELLEAEMTEALQADKHERRVSGSAIAVGIKRRITRNGKGRRHDRTRVHD